VKVLQPSVAQTVPRAPALSSLTVTHSSISVIVAWEKSTAAVPEPPPTDPLVVTVAVFVQLEAVGKHAW